MRAAVVTLLFLAASARADEVDDLVQSEMKKARVPGLALAVVKGGRPVKVQGYGLANLEHNVPVTPDTVFQTGSVGKQFTAAAVLLLAEDGKLSLDDPVRKWLPAGPERWNRVTVRHLLTHTSGIPDWYDKVALRKDYTDKELVAVAGKLEPAFEPGEKYEYSNTGYCLLGFVLNEVAGRFYGDVLKARVFDPLGMTTARIISDNDIVPHRAAGYRLSWGKYKNHDYVSPTFNRTADGSLYVTIRDMVKWDAALRDGKLLKPESMKLWWTPAKLNDGTTDEYGFGWEVSDEDGKRRVHHGGQWQGFSTSISRRLDDDLTVIVLTNLATGPAGRIGDKVEKAYLGK